MWGKKFFKNHRIGLEKFDIKIPSKGKTEICIKNLNNYIKPPLNKNDFPMNKKLYVRKNYINFFLNIVSM